MRTAGNHETLFGLNQRKLPDGNNEAQKLTLTSTFRYLKLTALNIHQNWYLNVPHIYVLGAYVMQEGV